MGRNPYQTCTVCGAPAEVSAAINAELAKPPGERMKLRDMEKLCHISKSAISRHTRKCLPKHILSTYRSTGKVDLKNRRVIVEWPDIGSGHHRFTLCFEYNHHGKPIERQQYEPIELAAGQLRDSDLLLVVEYEQKPIRNPGALLSPEQRGRS
jgi:hypothetical protein